MRLTEEERKELDGQKKKHRDGLASCADEAQAGGGWCDAEIRDSAVESEKILTLSALALRRMDRSSSGGEEWNVSRETVDAELKPSERCVVIRRIGAEFLCAGRYLEVYHRSQATFGETATGCIDQALR